MADIVTHQCDANVMMTCGDARSRFRMQFCQPQMDGIRKIIDVTLNTRNGELDNNTSPLLTSSFACDQQNASCDLYTASGCKYLEKSKRCLKTMRHPHRFCRNRYSKRYGVGANKTDIWVANFCYGTFDVCIELETRSSTTTATTSTLTYSSRTALNQPAVVPTRDNVQETRSSTTTTSTSTYSSRTALHQPAVVSTRDNAQETKSSTTTTSTSTSTYSSRTALHQPAVVPTRDNAQDDSGYSGHLLSVPTTAAVTGGVVGLLVLSIMIMAFVLHRRVRERRSGNESDGVTQDTGATIYDIIPDIETHLPWQHTLPTGRLPQMVHDDGDSSNIGAFPGSALQMRDGQDIKESASYVNVRFPNETRESENYYEKPLVSPPIAYQDDKHQYMSMDHITLRQSSTASVSSTGYQSGKLPSSDEWQPVDNNDALLDSSVKCDGTYLTPVADNARLLPQQPVRRNDDVPEIQTFCNTNQGPDHDNDVTSASGDGSAYYLTPICNPDNSIGPGSIRVSDCDGIRGTGTNDYIHAV